MPSPSSHHVPASPSFFLSPKPGPTRTRQLQPPRSIFEGKMQPALLDLLTRASPFFHLDAIDSLGINPPSFLRPFGIVLLPLDLTDHLLFHLQRTRPDAGIVLP